MVSRRVILPMRMQVPVWALSPRAHPKRLFADLHPMPARETDELSPSSGRKHRSGRAWW